MRRTPLKRTGFTNGLKRSDGLKRTGRVNPISDKQSDTLDAYREARDAFLAVHRRCQINWDGCDGWSSEVHHRISRGVRADLVATDHNFIAACRNCHHEVTVNPKRAYEAGVMGHAWDHPDSNKIVPRPEAS